MTRELVPIFPTPMQPREDPDGTTAFSDEAGLPGPPRLLAWTTVQENEAVFDIHVMWDTQDVHEAMDAGRAHARAFFCPQRRRGWCGESSTAPTTPSARGTTPTASSTDGPGARPADGCTSRGVVAYEVSETL